MNEQSFSYFLCVEGFFYYIYPTLARECYMFKLFFECRMVVEYMWLKETWLSRIELLVNYYNQEAT